MTTTQPSSANPLRSIVRAAVACALIAMTPSLACGAIDGGLFTPVGNDVVPRLYHAASRLPSGDVMVTGGLGLQIIPPSLFARNQIAFYRFDIGTFTNQYAPPAGGPAVTPLLITPRSGHSQTPLPDGRVLITGGFVNASGTSQGSATNTAELFDSFTGVISAAPNMNAARGDHTATPLPDGRVVVVGGSTWQIFSPVTNSWSSPFALSRTRNAHAAVLLTDFDGVIGDDRVVVIAGSGNGSTRIEILNPATGGSVLLSSTLAVGVDDLAATRLADGTVLIVAGQDRSTGDTISDCYRLDAEADVLTPMPDVPNRPNGIADHEIARFGRYVCIFGGEQQVSGTDTELNYTAIFDADTNAWIANGTMGHVHDDFASVALSGTCDLLLIDGGVPFLGQEAPSNSVEIFTLTIPNGCLDGDINNDGVLDELDAAALTKVLTGQPTPAEYGPRSDVNADGWANGVDVGAWLAVFLGL